MRAAILFNHNSELQLVDDLEVEQPRAGYVRVRITHCGLCHSDLYTMEGHFGDALPIIPGHEAAGIVDAVGEGVTHVRVGEPVAITPMPACGRCTYCCNGNPACCDEARIWMSGRFVDGTTPFRWHGQEVMKGNGVGGWSEMTVLPAAGVVPVPEETPLVYACLLACSIQTGVGAVFNTAKVEAGDHVLVMGLGGVGQAIVQGARIAGATRIIACDPIQSRRETARALGATDVLDPNSCDVLREVRGLTGGRGVRHAFDAVGVPDLVNLAVKATMPGGAIILVGAFRPEDRLSGVSPNQLIGQEKRIMGCNVGTAYAPRDYPRYMEMWCAGLLRMEPMVTQTRPFAEIDLALNDLRAGKGIRTVLEF
ncbi:hypothetical protein MB02_11955 [Croceicoccus estronivorus]|uniref:zinc-binding dehydrogenase n=1 Tax=Croceicoccus estronivorus TaxID=1172626 RepID=UPI000836245F|nr:zinc-binding dehydrogenase [Croceicoccus estronivorus]OCC23339.1 hypothetical protein MB02_11955 [Croceicoccus estronivorus]